MPLMWTRCGLKGLNKMTMSKYQQAQEAHAEARYNAQIVRDKAIAKANRTYRKAITKAYRDFNEARLGDKSNEMPELQ